MIKNESLDFVYIDANHKYDAVKKDLELWYPKVRKGGVFAGHDYLKMDWYADPNFLENKKDKNIFILPDLAFAGVFGVNGPKEPLGPTLTSGENCGLPPMLPPPPFAPPAPPPPPGDTFRLLGLAMITYLGLL
jgi:hypothetical protein